MNWFDELKKNSRGILYRKLLDLELIPIKISSFPNSSKYLLMTRKGKIINQDTRIAVNDQIITELSRRDRIWLSNQYSTHSKGIYEGCKEDLYKLWYDEFPVVDSLGYKPVKNQMFYDEQGRTYLNTYKTTKYLLMEKNNEEIIPERDFPLIHQLIYNLCSKSETYYHQFINWLSFKMQHPTIKLPTFFLFIGDQGTGKQLLGNVLKAIFGDNFTITDQEGLNTRFNEGDLKGKLLVFANELKVDDKKRFETSNKIKGYSDEWIVVEEKYKPRYRIRNYAEWMFASNFEKPIYIEKDDRRYNVFYGKKIDPELGKKIYYGYKKELDKFTQYIYNYNIDETKARIPIETEWKENTTHTMSKFEEENNQHVVRIIMHEFEHQKKYKIYKGEKWYLLSDLYEEYHSEYNEYCSKIEFGKKLVRAGFIKDNITGNEVAVKHEELDEDYTEEVKEEVKKKIL